MNTLETILSACTGVSVRKKTTDTWQGTTTNLEFYKTGEIKLPPVDIFIEITATATKGTIARVVDLNVETYGEAYSSYAGKPNENRLLSYDATLIFEVDGRKQQGRIKSTRAKILVGQPQTKYVRDVKTHEKVEIKNPVNKYLQEMKKGDWVIGTMAGKCLGIGRITRWTNHNVWAVRGDDLTDKNKEFKFDSIRETFTMPDDKHVQLLTLAVLKGWHGQ